MGQNPSLPSEELVQEEPSNPSTQIEHTTVDLIIFLTLFHENWHHPCFHKRVHHLTRMTNRLIIGDYEAA